MKTVAGVLAGVAIVAAGLGVYLLLSGEGERGRAEQAARAYSAYGSERCDRERTERASLAIWQSRGAQKKLDEMTARCKRPYEVLRIDQISDDVWRFHVRDQETGARCMEVDLDEFRVIRRSSLYVGGTIEGLADAPCGPKLWTSAEATRQFTTSRWARERKAKFVVCHGEGGSPGRSEYFRRFSCRYTTSQGDDAVTITTTGGTTFHVAETR